MLYFTLYKYDYMEATGMDYKNALIRAKKHLIVNPFSEDETWFLIPYESLHMFLLPIIEEL